MTLSTPVSPNLLSTGLAGQISVSDNKTARSDARTLETGLTSIFFCGEYQ